MGQLRIQGAFVAAALSTALFGSSARAEPTASSIDGSLGAGAEVMPGQAKGLTLRAQVLGSVGWLRLGSQLDLTLAVLDYTRAAPSGLAGVGLWVQDSYEVMLLGQLGIGYYDGWDKDTLLGGGDPGASATLPFVGAQVSLGIRVLESSRPYGVLRFTGFHTADLHHETVTYDWIETESFLFDDGVPSRRQSTATVGGQRIGGLVSLALGWD